MRQVVTAAYCLNPTRRGPSGPCCRANAMMAFFLDRRSTTFAKVKWWLFMDDDVYVRSLALLGFLSRFDAAAPLNVAAAPTAVEGFAPQGCAGTPVAEAFLTRKPWQVVSGLSRGALAELERGVYARGASEQCSALAFLGHDQGLGFFYWMHAIDVVFAAPWPYRGRALFDGGDIFVEAQNLSGTRIRAALNRSGETAALRRAISRFLFFHNPHPALEMFLFLKRIRDDERDVASVVEGSPRISNVGYNCTEYSRRRDVRAAGPWVPFGVSDCAAPLVDPCPCALAYPPPSASDQPRPGRQARARRFPPGGGIPARPPECGAWWPPLRHVRVPAPRA